jgi:small subunit ribosomal protein S12
MSTFLQKIKFKKKKHTNNLRSLFHCPQKKGIVIKARITTPKKPNSAKRKVVRILLSNKFRVTAKIKGQGHNLQSFSHVLVCGGRANDLPGVRFNMIKGGLDFSWKERFFRFKARSKYGIRKDDLLDYPEDYDAANATTNKK